MPTLNRHKREEAVRAATRAPYQLLEPVAELSYADADSENLLIQGGSLAVASGWRGPVLSFTDV